MEEPIAVTLLNDFTFCPASIYYHAVDAGLDKLTYGSHEQIEGASIHEPLDNATYSDRADILQGLEVYCERYGLIGKIDLFDVTRGVLTERKRKVSRIYDGYVFQLYAYCFALRELGYRVEKLRIYSMLDNRSYEVALPEADAAMTEKFESAVNRLQTFDFSGFRQTNREKCERCVYEPLCPYSCMGDDNADVQ